MAVNWVDVAILIVVVWNIANGVRQGLVGASVSLVAFLLSVSIALMAYLRVADWSIGQFGLPSLVAQPLAFGALWLITSFLVGVVGRFIAGPFGFLLRGSPLDTLLSTVPAAIHGFAICGFGLMLILAAPPLPAVGPFGLLTEIREGMRESQLAGELVERTAGYDRWARRLLEEPVNQTLSLLTVRPETGEQLDLRFRLDAPQADSAAEERMLELLNRERGQAGLGPLVRDSSIDAVARAHSVDMLRRGYFGHETPEGTSPFDRMLEGGVRFRVAAENLALAATAEIAHQGLMESPGHRANILGADFGRVGIGAVRVDGMGRVFTQNFAN